MQYKRENTLWLIHVKQKKKGYTQISKMLLFGLFTHLPIRCGVMDRSNGLTQFQQTSFYLIK